MGLFKLRKNKRYDYTPRFYDKEGDDKPLEIKHKFDEFRTTAESAGGLKKRFNNALSDLKGEQDKAANRRILYIVIALILIFLFIIDFDLSIFFG